MVYMEHASYNTFTHFKTNTKSTDIFRDIKMMCVLLKKSRYSKSQEMG